MTEFEILCLTNLCVIFSGGGLLYMSTKIVSKELISGDLFKTKLNYLPKKSEVRG